MKARVKWVEDVLFVGESGTGHTIVMDGPDCVVEVSAERSTEAPKVFTKIHVHYTVTGRNLKQNFVDRAVKLSTEKYCSASIMLAKTAEITHDYEVIEQT